MTERPEDIRKLTRLSASDHGELNPLVMAPEKDTNHGLKLDVDAMLAAVTPKTRLVYVANPNNPTGTYLNRDEMARLHAGLPDHVLLVIDSAYAEYVTAKDYEAGLEMASRQPNVVMTRTFSKLYGLAGLRIGWMLAPEKVCDDALLIFRMVSSWIAVE